MYYRMEIASLWWQKSFNEILKKATDGIQDDFAIHARGIAHRELGELQVAREILFEAYLQNPNDAYLRSLLNCLARLEDPEHELELLEDYSSGQARDISTRSDFWIRRGDIHRYLENSSQALKEYQRAAEIRKSSIKNLKRWESEEFKLQDPWFLMGSIHIEEGNTFEFLNCYEIAIGLNNTDFHRCCSEVDNLREILSRDHFVHLARSISRNDTLPFRMAQYLGLQTRLGQSYARITLSERPDCLTHFIGKYDEDGGYWLGEVRKDDKLLEWIEKSLKIDPYDTAVVQFKARTLVQEGKLDEAVRTFDNLIEIDPHHISGYLGKGLALRKLRKPKEEVENYNQAIRTRLREREDYARLAKRFVEIQEYEGAFCCYDEMIRLGYSLAYLEKGDVLIGLHDYESAIDCYDDYINCDPGNLHGYIYKGEMLRKLGKTDQAAECFAQAVDSGCLEDIDYQEIGKFFVEMGDYERVVQCYDENLKISPQSARVYVEKGKALRTLGKPDQEIVCYLQAVERGFQLASEYETLGERFLEIRQYERALQCYEKYIELDSWDPIGYLGKGESLRMLGRPNQEVECYVQATKEELHICSGFQALGDRFLEIEQYERALRCYEEHIKTSPYVLDGVFSKGEALKKMGKLDQAIECYTQVMEIKFESRAEYEILGDRFFELEQYEKALQCYEVCIELEPEKHANCIGKGK